MANNDANIRKFNGDLQIVADQLSGERGDLQKALDNLAVALSEVSSFVHDNRDELRQNVDGLTELSKTLVKQQDALREVLDESPVALANLDRTYNPKSGTLDTRNNFAQTDDPGLYLCSLLQQLRPAAGRLQGPAWPARRPAAAAAARRRGWGGDDQRAVGPRPHPRRHPGEGGCAMKRLLLALLGLSVLAGARSPSTTCRSPAVRAAAGRATT